MSPKNPTGGMVVLITNMSSLVLMESPYPLIPRAQSINVEKMNPNQDGFDNGGCGLA